MLGEFSATPTIVLLGVFTFMTGGDPSATAVATKANENSNVAASALGGLTRAAMHLPS
jgi:hypothetical protein